MVVLEIQPATHKPVRFDGIEYLRIGSYTKKLHEFPEKERELWRKLDKVPFEKQLATAPIEGQKVLQLLDFSKYFYDISAFASKSTKYFRKIKR